MKIIKQNTTYYNIFEAKKFIYIGSSFINSVKTKTMLLDGELVTHKINIKYRLE